MENITDKTVKCPDCGETRAVKKVLMGNEICGKCLDRAMTALEIYKGSPEYELKLKKALDKLKL